MNVASTNSTTEGSATGKLSTSAMRFTAGIDNEWRMDWGYMIGADWLSDSTLLTQSISASVSESTGGIDTTDTNTSGRTRGACQSVILDTRYTGLSDRFRF